MVMFKVKNSFDETDLEWKRRNQGPTNKQPNAPKSLRNNYGALGASDVGAPPPETQASQPIDFKKRPAPQKSNNELFQLGRGVPGTGFGKGYGSKEILKNPDMYAWLGKMGSRFSQGQPAGQAIGEPTAEWVAKDRKTAESNLDAARQKAIRDESIEAQKQESQADRNLTISENRKSREFTLDKFDKEKEFEKEFEKEKFDRGKDDRALNREYLRSQIEKSEKEINDPDLDKVYGDDGTVSFFNKKGDLVKKTEPGIAKTARESISKDDTKPLTLKDQRLVQEGITKNILRSSGYTKDDFSGAYKDAQGNEIDSKEMLRIESEAKKKTADVVSVMNQGYPESRAIQLVERRDQLLQKKKVQDSFKKVLDSKNPEATLKRLDDKTRKEVEAMWKEHYRWQ